MSESAGKPEAASSVFKPESREHLFIRELKEVPAPVRKVLEEYSGIEPDRVQSHIVEIRDRAYAIHPYPCIGRFRFLDMAIKEHPCYQEALQRVKNGSKLLDMGCCFAQELRQFALDGAPTENLYGGDLRMPFIELGYDLFLDKDKFKATFIEADIFDPESALKQLDGKLGIIYTEAFFHLFNLEQQTDVAKRLVKLFDPSQENLLFGGHIGQEVAGLRKHRSGKGEMYAHSHETWKALWDKVGEETGTKWEVTTDFTPVPTTITWVEPGVGFLRFTVKRV